MMYRTHAGPGRSVASLSYNETAEWIRSLNARCLVVDVASARRAAGRDLEIVACDGMTVAVVLDRPTPLAPRPGAL